MLSALKNIKIITKDSITVDFFYRQCKELFGIKKATKHIIPEDKKITEKDLHRPGLALAGFVDLFSYKRVQVFGNTEINYLKKLTKKERETAFKKYLSFDVPCIVVTAGNKVPTELLSEAERKKVPVFTTTYPTTRLAAMIADFLDDQFAQQASIHSSMVDVYGIGLLFCGKSGIGKSEIALDLVERGHRLVADDVVILSKKAENVLMGSGTAIGKHFMEIRGLGIINIQRIFGIRSIRYQKRVEVLIELEHWDDRKSYDRTGLDATTINILGVDIEKINLPIFPGKNITVIAEVIALNYLCKHYGYNAAKDFKDRLAERIKQNKNNRNKMLDFNLTRSTEYFEHDFE